MEVIRILKTLSKDVISFIPILILSLTTKFAVSKHIVRLKVRIVHRICTHDKMIRSTLADWSIPKRQDIAFRA